VFATVKLDAKNRRGDFAAVGAVVADVGWLEVGFRFIRGCST
jgi:hypothetical protein